MFDFENLGVYKKSLEYTDIVLDFLEKNQVDSFLSDQLKRAAISITINIAEGAGRFSPRDKRHYYIIANGSAFETVAILQIMNLRLKLNSDFYAKLYAHAEEIVKMLHGLIRNL